MTATATRLTMAEWAAKMRAPVRDHSYRLTGPGSSVVDYLAFKQMSGAAERTLDQYERDLARLSILLADRTLETITSEDLLHVVSTFPRASQRRAAAAYRDFFKWAYAWGKRPDNPMDRLPRIKREPVPLLEVFNQSEIDRLTSHPEIRDRALLRILLETGIRKGEAIALTLADVDLDQRRLKVRRGKGGKARVVPIGQRLAHEIAELAVLDGINPGWHLWYTVKANAISSRVLRAKPVGHGSFDRWWRRVLNECDVDYRNAHTTRHTCATRWLRQPGARMETLQRLLGHASISTTVDIYGHLNDQDVELDLALVLGDQKED